MSLQRKAPFSTIHSAHLSVLELTLQACKACRADSAEELMPVLIMYLQACESLQEQGHPIPLQAIDGFLRSSIIIKLE